MQAAIYGTDPDSLVTEVQTAELLNISIRTLQAWRIKLAGPRFVRVGARSATGAAISPLGSKQILSVMIQDDVDGSMTEEGVIRFRDLLAGQISPGRETASTPAYPRLL
jgi:hypothetical protein